MSDRIFELLSDLELEGGFGRPWPDYLQYGVTADDLPALLDLIASEALFAADADGASSAVPVHAWRILGQLGDARAVEPLLQILQMWSEDDWGSAELPRVLGMLGEPAFEPLIGYLNDGDAGEFAQGTALEGLKEITERHPELVGRLCDLLVDILRRKDPQAPFVNGLAVSLLIDCGAVEAIDDIREAFRCGVVDVFMAGDVEDVEIQLGLREERSTPRPDMEGPLPKPNADDTYELVNYYLEAYGDDYSIFEVSELDGYIAAVVCAPQLIKPSRWLAQIWGKHGEPAWSGPEDAQAFISAVTSMYNEAIDTLNEGSYGPVILERDVDGRSDSIASGWCVGFLRGMQFWSRLSAPLEKLVEAELAPIRLFGDEAYDERLMAMDADTIAARQDELGPAAVRIYDLLVGARKGFSTPLKRESPKVGRNDPCPCGSGKKYKKCCLH